MSPGGPGSTIMVTGDHPLTALTVARKVGIPAEKVISGPELDALSDEDLRRTVREVSVFARVTPEHKYRLVQAPAGQRGDRGRHGETASTTPGPEGRPHRHRHGHQGHGCRQGRRTSSWRTTTTTPSPAIFEGRKFFDNLRKGFGYYLSVKTALVLCSCCRSSSASRSLPRSRCILLELFMDLAASSGFVAEPAERRSIAGRPAIRRRSSSTRAC